MRFAPITRQGTPMAFQSNAWRELFHHLIRKLTWLSALVSVLAMSTVDATAANQRTLRKETPKTKSNSTSPTVRTVASAQPATPFLRSRLPEPIDPFLRRVHVLPSVQAGKTVAPI